MTELQLVLELATACVGGFFMAIVGLAVWHRTRPPEPVPATTTLFDHDGVPVQAAVAHAEHLIRKGFLREWSN